MVVGTVHRELGKDGVESKFYAAAPVMKNPKVAIILLAAGAGARLGYYPKALLEKDGVPLITRFWEEAKQLSPLESITVLGFYADQIVGLAQQSSKVVMNPSPELGQSSSARLGIESLQSDYDFALIALVDQPTITQKELKTLIDHASQLEGEIDAVIPCYQGQRGNPVLLSRRALHAILQISGLAPRQWLDQNPDRVGYLETHCEAYVCDVDMAGDLSKYEVQLLSKYKKI
jgi:molybdenum cofactor cytidylyltransferase